MAVGYNKSDWIFYGRLKRHWVQVFHFVQSGRVMVRLNTAGLMEEMLVPPNSSRTFQFFIDEELCKLEIIYHAATNKFEYVFQEQRYSTSSIGKWYARQDKLAWWKAAAALLLVALLVTPAVRYLLHRETTQTQLLTGMTATATISRLERTNDQHNARAYYSYTMGEKTYAQSTLVRYNSRDKVYETPNGLPLDIGSSYAVLLEPDNPQNHRLLFDQPDSAEWTRLKIATRDRCIASASALQLSRAMIRCDCQIRLLTDQFGTAALAQLYHQNTTADNNPQFNSQTYGRFMAQPNIGAFRQQCDQ